jgi:gliding motility-associated-like protein
VKDPPPILLVFSKTDVLCFGDSNGTAQVTAAGGILPYKYRWSRNPFNDTLNAITGLRAGTYTVTVTDSAGIVVTGNITIVQPPPIVIRFDSIPISCHGGNNGSLTALPSGGAGNFSFQWSPVVSSLSTIQGLSTGTYSVTVRDANNCTATASYFLAQPPVLSLNVNVLQNVFCYGGNDGAAVAQPSGGTPNYTFSWSNSTGQTNTATANDLTAGNQTVTVTDARGCTATANFTVSQPPVFSVAVSTTNANCPTSNDGAATANVTGGVGPYLFSWDGNTGPQTQTGLSFGNHSVLVTDFNQCTASTTFFIDTNYALRVTVQTTDATCFGLNNGSVVVTPVNGTPAFTFSYRTATGANANPSALAAGNYNLTVTDFLNCIYTASFSIAQPDDILLSFAATSPLCTGDANGSITVSVSGGRPGYSYLWSDLQNQTTATASGLAAGNYSVTITDVNQCTKTGSYAIADPANLQSTFLNRKEISCAGANDGSLTVQGEGGTPPYTYAWQQNNFVPSTNSATITNLGPDVYIATVTDRNGCSVSDTAVFTSPPLLNFNYIIVDSASCPGYADGKLRMQAQGGTPASGNEPYRYSLNNVNYQTSGIFTGLVAGDYRIYVKDSNNCMYDTLVHVPQPHPLLLQILPQDSTIDLGSSVVLQSFAQGYSGSNIQSYRWSPATALSCLDCAVPTATPYRDIEYSLTVFYLNRCTAQTNVNVFVGEGSKFFVPNLISPNGDGVNEVWEIYGYDLQSVQAQIFNRWGEKVFDSGGSQFTGWDGTYKGVKQEPGVFTYYVKATYLNGKVVEKTGSLTLVR